MSDGGLAFLIHGPAKAGKSWLSDTSPAPRLILDSEGGNAIRWTPSKKVYWDPVTEVPPVPDGTWDSCIVHVRDFNTVIKAFEWLNSGQHHFVSVSLDSISEIQQRCIDSLVGANQLRTQDWGDVLRKVSSVVRNFRDLTNHPIKPLRAIVFIAMSKEAKDGMMRPYVQGALATTLPYYLDLVAYLMVTPPDELGQCHRFLMIQPSNQYLSGERVGGRLGPYVYIPDNDVTVTRMLNTIFDGVPSIDAIPAVESIPELTEGTNQ